MTADEVVEFAEGLGRVAATGGGAKALAAALADATGSAVLVEDAEHRPIATAGRGALPSSSRAAANGARTIPITAGSLRLGWLTVTAPHAEAQAAMRLTASAIAVELSREATRGAGRKRGFWERLIDGAYHDVATIREEAGARGIALAAAFVCVALESDAPANLGSLAGETFRAHEGEVGVIERGTQCLVLVPAAREIDAENARTAASLLPKTASKRGITANLAGGVAPPVPVVEIASGVAAAQAALAISRRFYGFGRVASYDDLGAYPLLYHGGSAEELRAFARRTLEPLRSYDEKHQTELERTLRLYFSSGQNVKTAAAELAVHRHTVFYRLRQIGEITRRSLESPHDQLTLRLAIAIDALNE